MCRYLSIIFFVSVAFGQNDSLVSTFYPSSAQETLGFYIEGVRDGSWTEWFEGDVYKDFGTDGLPNTQDNGEGNGQFDSTETITYDKNNNGVYDPPQIKTQGYYTSGNRDSLWVFWYDDGVKEERSFYKNGKLTGHLQKWYPNGNRKEGGKYVSGVQDSIWTWYYDSGIKQEEAFFL